MDRLPEEKHQGIVIRDIPEYIDTDEVKVELCLKYTVILVYLMKFFRTC